jgi:hypothetical protein
MKIFNTKNDKTLRELLESRPRYDLSEKLYDIEQLINLHDKSKRNISQIVDAAIPLMENLGVSENIQSLKNVANVFKDDDVNPKDIRDAIQQSWVDFLSELSALREGDQSIYSDKSVWSEVTADSALIDRIAALNLKVSKVSEVNSVDKLLKALPLIKEVNVSALVSNPAFKKVLNWGIK